MGTVIQVGGPGKRSRTAEKTTAHSVLVVMNLNETEKLEKAGSKEAERAELKGVVSSEEQWGGDRRGRKTQRGWDY